MKYLNIKNLTSVAGALGLALAVAMPSVLQAAEYTISVEVDETTAGELGMVETYMDTAADGSSASKSLRRVANAAAGEVIQAAESRMTDDGILTMDDGSVVAMTTSDTLIAKPKHLGRAYPDIFFCGFTDASGGGMHHARKHRRACTFRLQKADGTGIKFRIPRARVCRGPEGHCM